MAKTFVKCPLCDNTKAENITTKTYPCSCGEDLEVTEYVCFVCGASFEMVDDVIVGEPINNIDDVFSTIIPLGSGVDIDEISNFLHELGVSPINLEAMDTNSSMSELTHQCLKCQAPSFDDGSGVIACTVCGHEWEIIKS